MIGKNNKWSAEDDRLLREMSVRGKSDQVIAVRLGRTRSAIKSRARALGITVQKARRLPLMERWAWHA